MSRYGRLAKARRAPPGPAGDFGTPRGRRSTRRRTLAITAGRMSEPATSLHDEPNAMVPPTYAGPAAIPKLPPIPGHPMPRPCSVTVREITDKPAGGYAPEQRPSAPSDTARNGPDGIAAAA